MKTNTNAPGSGLKALQAMALALLGALLWPLGAGAGPPPAPAARPAASFDAIRVLGNRYDPTLSHNIPTLSVTRGGQTWTVDFLAHYDRTGGRTGGLVRWGYPTSEVFEEEENHLVQYYQRGVVDWHLRQDLGRYVMERRLAWDYFGGGLGGSQDQGTESGRPANPNPGLQLGPWGHRVADRSVEGLSTGFRAFFDANGGEETFGFPKSEARRDTNQAGTLFIAGATAGFVRQYFQAAVLEYHEGTGDPVRLRLLGDDLRDALYPNGSWRDVRPFSAAGQLPPGGAYVAERVNRPSGSIRTGGSACQSTDPSEESRRQCAAEVAAGLGGFNPGTPIEIRIRARTIAELTSLPEAMLVEVLGATTSRDEKAGLVADLAKLRLLRPAEFAVRVEAFDAAQRARGAAQEAAQKAEAVTTAVDPGQRARAVTEAFDAAQRARRAAQEAAQKAEAVTTAVDPGRRPQVAAAAAEASQKAQSVARAADAVQNARGAASAGDASMQTQFVAASAEAATNTRLASEAATVAALQRVR